MSPASAKSPPTAHEPWALQLPAAGVAELLGPLRLAQAVEMGLAGDVVWLRGRRSDDATVQALNALPATARYTWTGTDVLRPRGSRLATARLPALAWMPVREGLRVTFPVPALGGGLLPPVGLELVRSSDARAATAVLTDLGTWSEWAAAAPAVRLARLRFAATADGAVLIVGTPPPPISGRALVEDAGVIVPAGFAWTPRVSATVVRRVVGANDGDRVLWDERGVRVLREELFAQATRAAVRATVESLKGAAP